jgi:hypothetical protein
MTIGARRAMILSTPSGHATTALRARRRDGGK